MECNIDIQIVFLIPSIFKFTHKLPIKTLVSQFFSTAKNQTAYLKRIFYLLKALTFHISKFTMYRR